MKKEIADIRNRFNLPTSIVVEVDTREKYPIKFPKTIRIVHPEKPYKWLLVGVETIRATLPFGDYRVKKYPDCCVIERKAGQRELYKNIFNPKDAVRQAKSFRKLSGCEFPYLLIELTPAEILQRNPHIPDTEILLNRLSLVFAKYGFHVLWIPWRSRKRTSQGQLGLFLTHLMLAHALRKSYEILPEVIDGGIK